LQRLIYIALALTPLVCFMAWGGGQSAFLFEAEYQLFFRQKGSAETFTHPLVLLPLAGQLLLLFSASQKKPSRRLAVLGQLLLSPLVALILLAGILSLHMKMVLSTLPFIVSSIIFYNSFSKKAP